MNGMDGRSNVCEGTNKSMEGRTKEWTKQHLKEWINRGADKWTNEKKDEATHVGIDEQKCRQMDE